MRHLALIVAALGALAGLVSCISTETEGGAAPEDRRFRVDAGEDMAADEGDTVLLRAAGTNGLPPYVFRWNVERAPDDAKWPTLTDERGAETGTGPLTTEGRYVFRVVAVDAAGQDAYAFVSVRVGLPTVPLTLRTTSPDILLIDEQGNLSVEIEGDDEFDQVTYAWEVVSGDAALDDPTVAEPVLTATRGETIQLHVEVTAIGAEAAGSSETDLFVVAVTDDRPQAVLTITGFGEIVFELRADVAPKTVANFLRYVDDGFYDGLLIHRVESDFVIQAGGYRPTEDGELEGVEVRDPIPGEADGALSNARGTVAMALLSGDVDSATSQWFINLVDNNGEGDSTTNLDESGFTAFATVIEGMNVVDEIAEVDTGTRSGPDGSMRHVPVEDILIESARRR